ncbi:MAG: hypothetical protein HC842_02905, partial [Cytophagales bacterium]|nr:hypothetical protein [Cytophagales bacterium]
KVFHNTDGNYGFTKSHEFSVTAPSDVELSDVDGDGLLDLVVAGGSSIYIFENTTTTVGTPDFNSTSIEIDAGLVIAEIAVGDLDQDGRQDLALVHEGDDQFTILQNTGATTISVSSFDNVFNLSTTGGPMHIDLADLDGDGKLDLVVSTILSTYYVFRNTSVGSSINFDATISQQAGAGQFGFDFGDLDGDGDLDLVIGTTTTSYAYLIQNHSTPGNIQLSLRDSIGSSGLRQVQIADLNGDGRPDIAGVYFYDGFYLYQNNSPLYQAPAYLSTSAGDGQVQLDWPASPIPNFSHFVVRRSTNANMSGASVLNNALATDSFLDNTVVNGQIYFYGISAVDINGESSLEVVNAAVPLAAQGPGNALSFDGSGSYLETHDFEPIGTSEFAFSIWFQVPESGLGGGVLLTTRTGDLSSSGPWILFNLAGNQLNFELGSTGGTTVYHLLQADFDLNGQWHHMVGQRRSGQFQLYVDGVLRDSQAEGALKNLTKDTLRLGAWVNVASFYTGALDEVAYFKRSLSPIEINQLASVPAQGNTNGLYHLYHFNEPAGNTVAYDAAQGNRHLAWVNTPGNVPSVALAPFKPDSLWAVASSTQLALIWTPSTATDLITYGVLRRKLSEPVYTYVNSTSVTNLTVPGLENDSSYVIGVYVQDASGLSSDTLEILGIPVIESGHALAFDGNDSLYTDKSDPLDNLPAITLQAWVKPLELNREQSLIERYMVNGSDTGWYLILQNDNTLRFWVRTGNGGVRSVVSNTPLELGRWHQVVAYYAGGQAFIYINGKDRSGVRTGTGTGALPAVEADMVVAGTAQRGGGKVFVGQMDELAIWSRALSQPEILEYLDRPVPATDPGLVSLQHMDEVNTPFPFAWNSRTPALQGSYRDDPSQVRSGAMTPLLETFKATPQTDSVILSWKFLSGDMDLVRIYRHTSSAIDTSTHLLTTVAYDPMDTFYVDHTAPIADSLWYTVVGVDLAGQAGELSPLDSVFIPQPVFTYAMPIDLGSGSYYTAYSVTPLETSPTGVALSRDGSRMFVIGYDSDQVREYLLGTPFDVSSASFNAYLSVGAQEAFAGDMVFDPSGTRLFIIGDQNNSVIEYRLGAAYELSTASYTGRSYSVAGQDGGPLALAFKPDGMRMYVLGNGGNSVYTYQLSQGFDITTATYVSALDVSAQEGEPQGLAFNAHGTRMLLVGSGFDQVRAYELSSPWDPTTGSLVQSFAVAAQDPTMTGLAFDASGTRMYLTCFNGAVYQYQFSDTAFVEAPAGDGSVVGELLVALYGSRLAQPGGALSHGSDYSVDNLARGAHPAAQRGTRRAVGAAHPGRQRHQQHQCR